MSHATDITSVKARQVYSERGHPGIEATVITANGAVGVAICTAGVSIGIHEVEFAYDGGSKFNGKGVQKAAHNANTIIAPKLIGMDATRQLEIDSVMLEMEGPDSKVRLGGNATAAISAAVLKAGAAALGIPLYQHIGGVKAFTLPVPGNICLVGSDRYGSGARSGGKPSYAFMAYNFDTFSDASYACWDITNLWVEKLNQKFGVSVMGPMQFPSIPVGMVKHDKELWDLMVETINKNGYENKIGIQVDVATATYYEKELDRYVGIFSAEPKTIDDLMKLYTWMTKEYPFIIIEDPFDEDDYVNHAILTKEVDIQIVGDDLFTTNPARVLQGIEAGAANTVLLKVNQIGTITESFEMVRLAYDYGYGVMPCNSRGEGDVIADYSVGLGCGTIRESGVGPSGNRFLQIETELGSRACFAGPHGLKGKRFEKWIK